MQLSGADMKIGLDYPSRMKTSHMFRFIKFTNKIFPLKSFECSSSYKFIFRLAFYQLQAFKKYF